MSFQERQGTILTAVFHGELDVWVLGIDTPEELVTMLYLLDDKCVIYVLSHGWWGQGHS